MERALTNPDEILAEKCGMSIEEFHGLLGQAKYISTSGDCKTALSQIRIAQRHVAKVYAAIKSRISDSTEQIEIEINSAKRRIYKFKSERQKGMYPLEDKDIILEEFTKYAKEVDSNWGDIMADCTSEAKKKAKMKEIPQIWKDFMQNNIDSIDKIPFTSESILDITEADVTGMTDTFIGKTAKEYGTAKVANELKVLHSIESTVKELLSMFDREITALVALARLISSEHYSMTSTTRMDMYGGNNA